MKHLKDAKFIGARPDDVLTWNETDRMKYALANVGDYLDGAPDASPLSRQLKYVSDKFRLDEDAFAEAYHDETWKNRPREFGGTGKR